MSTEYSAHAHEEQATRKDATYEVLVKGNFTRYSRNYYEKYIVCYTKFSLSEYVYCISMISILYIYEKKIRTTELESEFINLKALENYLM